MTHATPVLDIFSPEFSRDPAPMIDRMLAEQPIAFDARLNAWLVGRHADIKALEHEPRLSSQRQGYVSAMLPEHLRARIQPLVDWYAGWMVMRDGAAHRRLRRLTATAFQPRNLQALAPRIDQILDELLDAALSRGEMEVKRDLAYPLPRTVICEMIGIPEADRARFSTWNDDLTALLAAELTSEQAIDHALATRADFEAYFAALLTERRAHPREGEILTALIQATEADDSLSDAEIIDLVAFLMVGAYETTTHLITSGVYTLWSHPDQLAAVREDPDLIPGLVEETLRYHPSITLNVRAVAESFAFRGHPFEAGQMVYFIGVAANRDPERFPDPHRFDVRRANSREHVSFGFGPHFCIGAPLARMEAQHAFRRLLARAPDARLPEQEIQWLPKPVVRELAQLRLAL